MEEWKPVAHAPTYAVSSTARVRNVKTGKELKQHLNPSGYMIVGLHGSSAGRTFLVHRLVAEAFVQGFRNGLEVNHKDGNKRNNSPENLEWVTRSENQMHRMYVLGKRPSIHTLTEETVRQLVKYRNENCASMSETGAKFGVHATMVQAIFSGRAWGRLWTNGKPECTVPRNLRKSGHLPYSPKDAQAPTSTD